jgi:3-hydroxyacyl-CoA dehydrogenase
MKAEGLAPADWVNDMLASESKSFYTIKEGLLISTISQLKHRQKFLDKIHSLF